MKYCFLLVLAVCMACTSKAPEKTASNEPMPAEQEIVEYPDLVAQLKFKEGSSVVTHEAQEELKILYEKAMHKDRPIAEVKLVTWADEEYPSDKDLPEWQQKLAIKRNDNLEKALRSLDQALTIRKFSMAEKPKGQGAELRQSMEDVNEGTSSYASKSIVMFLLKKK